jgi:hypothetical protein
MLPVYRNGKGGLGDKRNLLGLVHNLFLPSVLCFCQQNVLPAKAHLYLDNASSHPAILSEFKTPLDDSVVYIPSNTTSPLIE